MNTLNKVRRILVAFLLHRTSVNARRPEKIHEYAFTYFPDPVLGEWYGYLHNSHSLIE